MLTMEILVKIILYSKYLKINCVHFDCTQTIQHFTGREPLQSRRASQYGNEQKACMKEHHRSRHETL
jgi:hypothetical protein